MITTFIKVQKFVRNLQHFVETIKDIKLRPNELMVSFDIKSLFMNVPIDEALELIHRLLLEDETLGDRTALTADHKTHLLSLCLRSTYFMYRGEHYQQQDGAAMGSPISPVVANIYMEMFEDLALRTTARLRMWRRYVDDTFCVMNKQHTQSFLDHLNSLRPTIQFTMELERDGKLPFLDTLLTRREDGRVNIGIHRKTTHTDRYLQNTSHLPAHVKLWVASCLFHRARTVASTEHIEREKKHLADILGAKEYPERIIKIAVRPRREREPKESPKYTIRLPYVSELSEDIRRICRRYNIRTVFTIISTICLWVICIL